ncbi:YibE/F family protein [Patulibacter defluvii]|uniref:YibE/F family protein n=1 Tax=Patulibacter defluvii TaxID=3095358 RepID=UPI002A74F1AF|nr:YibE/F family protein [Patulibacter sp. DM4]
MAADSPLRTLLTSRAGRALVGAVAVVALLTVVGLAVLWPDGSGPKIEGGAQKTVAATVDRVTTASCGGPTEQRCATAHLRIAEGADRGQLVPVVLGPPEVSPELHPGDDVRVAPQPTGPEGSDPAAAGIGGEGPAYSFVGVDRHGSLVWLAVLFALLGAVVARGRGLLALAGTAFSMGLVVLWLVPAILDGGSPVLVAVVGALAVMFITTGLTYGVTTQSLAAVTGIGVALVAAGLLGVLWTDLAALDGKDGELSSFSLQSGGHLPLQGIVLAGMVIGALGVLTDTVVSQVSTVAALHRTDPRLSARRLYREAFTVGRDHLAATIHTLVLAYAGATLPILLIVSANGVPFGDAINDSRLAEPIVSTLVGSIALILAVPLSTALAAVLVGRVPTAALGDGHHHHHH